MLSTATKSLLLVGTFLSAGVFGAEFTLPFPDSLQPRTGNGTICTTGKRTVTFTTPLTYEEVLFSPPEDDLVRVFGETAQYTKTVTEGGVQRLITAQIRGGIEVYADLLMVPADWSWEKIVQEKNQTGLAAMSLVDFFSAEMEVVGGAFDGRPVPLKGKQLHVSGRTSEQTRSVQEDAFLIGLDLGVRPRILDVGSAETYTRHLLLIEVWMDTWAVISDSRYITEEEASRQLLGKTSLVEYNLSVLQRYNHGTAFKLKGAVPELLYLYDFSGRWTAAPTNFVSLNQYDAGLIEQLPVREGKPGGNACGPIALAAVLSGLGKTISVKEAYDNTMEFGLNRTSGVPVGAEFGQGFWWPRAEDWLSGLERSRAKFIQTDGKTGQVQRSFSPRMLLNRIALPIETTVAGNGWQIVDALLELRAPVLVRTDLTSCLEDARGGGHVIAILGMGADPLVQSVVGDYYIVMDPGGHYYAHPKGPHYGRAAELQDRCAGITDSGNFAIYPKNKLQSRVTVGSSCRRGTSGTTLFRGMAIVPLPALRVKVHSPVALAVKDPGGRRTGQLSATSVITEIPSSSFGSDWADEEEEGFTVIDSQGSKTVLIRSPANGTWEAELLGTGSGSFELEWLSMDASGNANIQTSSGQIVPGQKQTYPFALGGTTPKQPRLNWATPPNLPPRIQIEGEAGKTYILQRAFTLGTPWADILEVSLGSQSQEISEPPAGNSATRFYRLLLKQ